MARSQKAEVVITCNASQAKQMIEMLKAKAEQLRQTYAKRVAEYKKLLAQSGKETDKTRALRKEINALERQFKTLDSAEKHNLQELGDINKILKNLSGATTRQLRSALSTLKKELENTSGSEIQRQKQLQMQMKAVQKQIDKNTGAVSKHGNAWKTSIRNIGTYLGMFTLVSTAISKLGDVFRKNLDMSDQLSQIRMVSGLSMRMVDKLSERLRQVDTRSTLTDLQQIAYEGSKLGFGKYGVEGLAGFTEAANQVNVALKEQMGEDTLPMMSKMVENMGLIKKMGIEKALLSTGSAMFRLSASSTSSANNIMEFAKRLAGLASVSKITTPQLLALGSASDSMMLMPEVASTAFNKIITSLQTQPQTIAKALKIPKDTLKDMLSAGKTMDALLLVFQRMHDMGNMNALGGIFKPLGSDGAKLNAVAVSMAKNVDMLREHVKTATDAFIDGQDITKEYNLRQMTANGLMERANNLWAKAFVNKDGVDSVKELALQWYNLSKEMTGSQGVMTSLRLTFELLIFDAKLIIRLLPQLILFFSTYGIIRGIQAAVVAISELRTAMLAAKTAQEGLNIAMKSNVFGAIAALVVTVVGTIYAYASATKEAAEKQNSLNDAVHEYKVQAKAAEIEVYRHYQAILQAKKGTQERTAAIKEFNKIYGGYLDNLLTETSSAKDLANAYHAVVKQLQNKYALEARDKEMKRVVQPRLQWSANRLENYDESIKGTKHSAQSSSWLYGFYQDHSNLGPWGFANLLRRHAGYNISDAQFAAAINHRSDKFFHDPDGKFQLEGITKGYKWHPAKNAAEANAFWNAMAYYAQQKSTDKWTGKVNAAFGPFISNEDLSSDDTDAGKFNNDKTQDKLAAKAAAKAERERLKKEREARAKARKAANEELKLAKTDATAIISNIEAYFNLQLKGLKDRIGKDLTPDVGVALTAQLKDYENRFLAAARFRLSGHQNEHPELDFAQMLQQLSTGYLQLDTENGGSASKALMERMQKVDLDKAYRNLAKFNGSEAVYGIDAGAILDEIYKNGTENLKANADIHEKQADAAEKVIESFDILGNVVRKYTQQAIDVGLNPVDVRRYAGGANPSKNTAGAKGSGNTLDEVVVNGTATKRFMSPFYEMLMQFPRNGYHPYENDISTDMGMWKWITGLVSNFSGVLNPDGTPKMVKWANNWETTDKMMNGYEDDKGNHIKGLYDVKRNGNGIPDLDDLKKILDANNGELRNNIYYLYNLLMQYGDDFWEEQKKRSDELKKIIDTMWQRSNEKAELDARDRMFRLRSYSDTLFGKPRNDWQPFGFANTVRNDDTELAQSRSSFQSAQAQYELAQLRVTSPERIAAKQAAVDSAQTNYDNVAKQNDKSILQKQFFDAQTRSATLWKEYLEDLSIFGADTANIALVRYNNSVEKQNELTKRIDESDNAIQKAQNTLDKAKDELASEKSKFNDPKLLQEFEKKREEAEQAYYSLLKQRVETRMQSLTQWTEPIEQAGTALGAAFAQMTDDADAGRKAVKAALRDMVSAYGKSVISIIKDLMMYQVKRALVQDSIKKNPLMDKILGVNNSSALFNDNGIPTGTIENANIIIGNSNLSTPAPTVTTGAANGTAGATDVENGNGAAKTAATMTPEEGVKAGEAGAAEGARAAAKVASELGEGNSSATDVVGGAVGSVVGDGLSGLSSKVKQKVAENKAIEKENKAHNAKMEKENKASSKSIAKEEKASGKARAQAHRENNKNILAAETVKSAGVQTITSGMNAVLDKKQKESDATHTDSVVKNATTDTEGGIVSGAANIIGKLGWWGIPLVAVITALLNGLLSAFLSKLGKSNTSSTTSTNTKLKTGMLTYDEGNVQQYRGLLDGQSYPVVGDDGRVYAATSVSQAVTGIVRSPIATMINGQPSLVAERGPEMVIGRETTAAMMMNRPDLLREIIIYDKNRSSMPYRTYDAGNVQQVAAVSGATGVDSDTKAIMGALSVAINSLVDRLNKPFEARMDPYGRGGALDALNKAQQFMNKHK